MSKAAWKARWSLSWRIGVRSTRLLFFDYLRDINSAYPGSVASVHASSAELACEQLAVLSTS